MDIEVKIEALKGEWVRMRRVVGLRILVRRWGAGETEILFMKPRMTDSRGVVRRMGKDKVSGQGEKIRQ